MLREGTGENECIKALQTQCGPLVRWQRAAFTGRALAEVLLQLVDNQHFPKAIQSGADSTINSNKAYTRRKTIVRRAASMEKAKYDEDHKSENFKMKSLHLENSTILDADRRMLNQLCRDRRFLDRRLFDRRLFDPQLRDGFTGEDKRSLDRRTLARRASADRRGRAAPANNKPESVREGEKGFEFSHKCPQIHMLAVKNWHVTGTATFLL